MDETKRAIALKTPGFMPEEEGLALYEAAREVAELGPLLEIGAYCGKSTIYLGAAAELVGGLVLSLDHHRGSEEHQPGEGYHDPLLVDIEGRVDTLPCFRKTVAAAGLEGVVVALVGPSRLISRYWTIPLSFVLVDGGHSRRAAQDDYEGWVPHLMPGGLLAIHDVFEDPAEGGRPPFEIFQQALGSGAFKERSRCASLRVLERVGEG